MASVSTTVEVIEGNGEWVINHFSLVSKPKGDFLVSPRFSMGGVDNWCLSMAPSGANDSDDGFVAIYLENMSNKIVSAAFRISIDNRSTEQRVSVAKEFGMPGKAWGLRNFISRNVLLSPGLDGSYDDRVVIRCQVTIAKEIVNSDRKLASHQVPQASLPISLLTQARAMAQLLDDGFQSDVQIRLSDSEELISAHRSILAARSPVFKAMFSHNMSETLEGVVRLDGISYVAFKQLLRFIYTGFCALNEVTLMSVDTSECKDVSDNTLERSYSSSSSSSASSPSPPPSPARSRRSILSKFLSSSSAPSSSSSSSSSSSASSLSTSNERSFDADELQEMASELLGAADRFQLPELQLICSAHLVSTLSVENAAERLALADMWHAEELKRHCLHFMSADKQRLSEVMATEGVELLSQEQLLSVLKTLAPPPPNANTRKRARDEDDDDPATEIKRLRTLRVVELKSRLKSLGLSTTGLKNDLIQRLEQALAESVRNRNNEGGL